MVKKWFGVPFAKGKPQKASVLDAVSSLRRQDSTSFLEKVVFQKFEHTAPPEPSLVLAIVSSRYREVIHSDRYA
jgi:hypothetical protein